MEGWYGRIFRGCGFFDPDKPIRKFTKKELDDLLYKEPTKIKVDGINLTYEGLIPKIQKSMLSKDVEAMQPHIRAFVERVEKRAESIYCKDEDDNWPSCHLEAVRKELAAMEKEAE
jgi:excinuclease UvrABC ATPase subunit